MEIENLFQLYPFGLLIDSEGKIIRLGRSASKILNCTVGDDFVEYCNGRISKTIKNIFNLNSLLTIKSDQGSINIRGQMLRVEDGFFYTGALGFNKTDALKEARITFQDLGIQENTFDFLMLLGAQEQNIHKLEESLRKQKVNNRFSSFLNDLALELPQASEIREVINIGLIKLSETFRKSKTFCAKIRNTKNINNNPDLLKLCEDIFSVNDDTKEVASVGPLLKVEILERLQDMLSEIDNDLSVSVNDDSSLAFAIKLEDAEHIFYLIIRLNEDNTELAQEEKMIRLLKNLMQSKMTSISAEKQNQEAMMQKAHVGRIAMLGELSASVAHEINNPLAIIGLMADKTLYDLEQDGLSEKYQSNIETITNSIDRIVKIINGLKAYARGGAGDSFVQVKLNSIIDDTVTLMQSKIKHKKVAFEKKIHNENLMVSCIPVQIVQVLTNLISNGIDASTDTSNPWVKLESTSDGDYLKLMVSDSGPRIPDHIADKLMTPFFTTKEQGKGTGLGLSLSLKIADHHGAKFYLDRSLEQTCFVLELPLRQKV